MVRIFGDNGCLHNSIAKLLAKCLIGRDVRITKLYLRVSRIKGGWNWFRILTNGVFILERVRFWLRSSTNAGRIRTQFINSLLIQHESCGGLKVLILNTTASGVTRNRETFPSAAHQNTRSPNRYVTGANGSSLIPTDPLVKDVRWSYTCLTSLHTSQDSMLISCRNCSSLHKNKYHCCWI